MENRKLKLVVLGAGLALLAVVFLVACAGSPARTSPAATNTGTISGMVTNSATSKGEPGVKVVLDPPVKDMNIVTDAGGAFTAQLPIGAYNLTFQKENFKASTQSASLAMGVTATRNVTLTANSPVLVNTGKAQEAALSASVTLKATVTPLDGSTVKSFAWTQTSGPKAQIDKPDADTTNVTLADASTYKLVLLEGLELHDRFGVQAISPYALEGAEVAAFKVTVTTTSGTYTGTVNVTARLPYVVNGGIQNVSVGQGVLLNGKKQDAYSWTLAAPTGSKATLGGSSGRNPLFTPDVAGKYTVTESNSKATVNIFAGTWVGAISGVDDNGKLLSANCTTCHNGTAAPDKFTSWKNSGHAEIFTVNLNTSASYGEQCFACHTVGFDKTVSNGGFDDASDYSAFAAAGILTKPGPNNWANALSRFSKTAALANIQCENCHGPNASTLHMNGTLDKERISISSDACGNCHGEPPRHGRFQQWEESGHGNFELAIDEATVETRAATAAHCGRCHSGQGFLAWTKQGDLTKQIQGKSGNATVDELKALGLTRDTVQPQTCVTCHDPHNPGNISGDANNATVRIMGDTAMLPAGFQAKEVGKGALCMTCHNTRNGVRNDTVMSTAYSAPHTAAQADVLMGQNAYFVTLPQRSPHAALKDTCVTCHMQSTPPPKEFSYNQTGTNHAFKASTGICGDCHTKLFDGKAFQSGIEDKLHALGAKMGAYLLGKMGVQVSIQDYTPHTFNNKSYDVKSDPVVINKDNIAAIEPTEPHGQQGFLVKLKTPVTVTYKPTGENPHTMSITEAEVQLGNFTTDGTTALVPLTDVLVRVGWNFFLVEGDDSFGIHNPDFARAVLDASLNALR
ncbi:MAG: carboxypeptidase regulatory-like domain-containing protein [Chloroflexi bacterium]|nr:carboxypeptidase regulatory-like domain-containing protein [Chloroflexota bacterium]